MLVMALCILGTVQHIYKVHNHATDGDKDYAAPGEGFYVFM